MRGGTQRTTAASPDRCAAQLPSSRDYSQPAQPVGPTTLPEEMGHPRQVLDSAQPPTIAVQHGSLPAAHNPEKYLRPPSRTAGTSMPRPQSSRLESTSELNSRHAPTACAHQAPRKLCPHPCASSCPRQE